MRLLIIEDEKEIADGLAAVLEKEGYLVDVVYDGLSGLDYIFSNIYDLVLLDIMLPKINGLDILKNIRKEGIPVPTILVTARSHVTDKVLGLDSGADDYITKPFDINELLARIRVRTRSAQGPTVDTLTFGDLSLQKRDCILCCGTNSIKLGSKEYQLIEYFLLNAGHILTKDMIISKIWGPSDESEYNNVEVYVSFLRKKLRFIHSDVVIKTTKNVGYSLVKGESI